MPAADAGTPPVGAHGSTARRRARQLDPSVAASGPCRRLAPARRPAAQSRHVPDRAATSSSISLGSNMLARRDDDRWLRRSPWLT